jgi:hypothetical protein
MKGALVVGVVVVVGIAGVSVASAQRSNFGTITLTSGFTPDPHVAAGTSGGQANASNVNSQCRGWISSTPDHILVLRGNFAFLRIFAESEGDTTLVIQTPNGQVRCNDDTYGRNPAVEGEFPAGTYRVWLGSYAQGENLRYQLKLTELQSVRPGSGGGAATPSPGGNDANRGLQIDSNQGNFDPVALRAGFTPDPARKTGVSGGQLNATRLGGDCRGWIAGRPDHIVTLQSNFNFFRVFVNSESDTTLVIRLPNGRFVCNDDANGLNPAITQNRWRRGTYRVWVGSYAEGDNSRYSIGFTELQSVTQ